ncbi:MAG: hypothetical protein KDD61_11310, partial [Bdellovibrionales bacterium]|nr:hypothetical protein [Bdellovibrionales bacterium]
ALHQETKETFGLSVVVELSITYLLQNSWYTGLGANYITQASNVDDLSLVIGNMDILVYVGKRF